MKSKLTLKVDEWFNPKNKPYLEFRSGNSIFRVTDNPLKIEEIGGTIKWN